MAADGICIEQQVSAFFVDSWRRSNTRCPITRPVYGESLMRHPRLHNWSVCPFVFLEQILASRKIHPSKFYRSRWVESSCFIDEARNHGKLEFFWGDASFRLIELVCQTSCAQLGYPHSETQSIFPSKLIASIYINFNRIPVQRHRGITCTFN